MTTQFTTYQELNIACKLIACEFSNHIYKIDEDKHLFILAYQNLTCWKVKIHWVKEWIFDTETDPTLMKEPKPVELTETIDVPFDADNEELTELLFPVFYKVVDKKDLTQKAA